MATHTEADQRAAVRDRINDIETAMMTTLSEAGTMHSRPMATAEVTEQWDTLWFATDRHSAKVDELSQDGRVGLTYVDDSHKHWVSISGRGRVVNDKAKVKELWRSAWQAWFDGPEDPDLVLIRVEPDIAEYWDSDSRTVAALKLATAAVTGTEQSLGNNEKVQM